MVLGVVLLVKKMVILFIDLFAIFKHACLVQLKAGLNGGLLNHNSRS